MTNQERYEEDLKIIPKLGDKTYDIDGFEAVIYRHSLGHLCGYVRIPLDSDINGEREIECHGGITFQGEIDFNTINGNFIGFDCAHYGDWIESCPGFDGDTYKDTEFVLNEIKNIIKQLKEKQQ